MSYTNGLDKPTDYFNTKLYTGNGSTQNITSLDFQPDWVWIKGRNQARNNTIFDSVRGVQKQIHSNKTSAESTQSNALSSFNSDGFSVGDNTGVNENSTTYASWNWLGANGTASNTDGSITSTVSANTTAGFSIVSYSGSNSNVTVGHGIDTPKMIIIKNRTSTSSWTVYHESIGNGHRLILNSSNAKESTNQFSFGTSPTSSVFALGGGYNDVCASGQNYIAYCFSEVKSFSKFGKYVGNGNADGTFVYTGFKPAFVMGKASSRVENWYMFDNKRDNFNPCEQLLKADENSAEFSGSDIIDFTSQGFKLRSTNEKWNESGSTYIFMAFAESPFVTSGGIPTTAR